MHMLLPFTYLVLAKTIINKEFIPVRNRVLCFLGFMVLSPLLNVTYTCFIDTSNYSNAQPFFVMQGPGSHAWQGVTLLSISCTQPFPASQSQRHELDQTTRVPNLSSLCKVKGVDKSSSLRFPRLSRVVLCDSLEPLRKTLYPNTQTFFVTQSQGMG